jgi:hypothetical protein
VSILSTLQWLEATEFSTGIRESTYVWAYIDGIHVLGLCLFVGLTLFWDLRLLNVVMRRVPVSEIWNRLIPWMTIGFVIMLISGLGLFVSDPVRFYGNIIFRIKVVALALAALNALAFHYGIERKLLEWDTTPTTPMAAKLAGAASITLWAVIIVAGRLIAYNWFEPLV